MCENKSDATGCFVYTWKLVNAEGGIVSSSENFLTTIERDASVPIILKAGHRLVKEERIVPNISPDDLLSDVFGYILWGEFDLVVTRKCYGCQNKAQCQTIHMSGGCLDTLENRVTAWGEIAFFKMSPCKLYKGYKLMSEYLKVAPICLADIERYYKDTDWEKVLLNGRKDFYSEFNYLKRLL